MLDFLNSFKSLIKLEQVTTDNNVFKLHYKLSVIMLVLFSILLTSKQYFGDPIICDVEEKQQDLMDTYCWIMGTYIIEDTLTDEQLPGLGNPYDKKGPVIWQKYYQWVCIIFCAQALLFYIPRYLWKSWEGGRLRTLVQDLGGPLVNPSWAGQTRYKLLEYLMCGKYSHDVYSFRYTLCEFLNLANVSLQIYLLDYILTGHFSLYGLQVVLYNDVNPMTKVFPKVTKCLFNKFGPSGGRQVRDALCVLPLNILNEKLFLVLWFWLFFLAVVSGLAMVYRALVMAVPRVRVYILMAQCRYLTHKQVHVLVDRLSYGDFFLLYHIGKNVNPLVYKELVSDMYEYVAHGRTLKGDTDDYNDNM